jgi:DNA-binding transcriptional MerR regulator
MRISELARRADVSIATIKFYLREELLSPGTPISVTQAEYDQAHLDRLRLIRVLVDVGRLPLITIRALLATLDGGEGDTPQDASRALATAHAALPPHPPENGPAPQQALAVVATLGWQVDAASPALRQLESALVALDAVGLVPREGTLRTYAQAALSVAEADATSLPTGSPAGLVRQVVLGTVMYEPVLIALRRLAQQHAFREVSSRTRR